MTVTRNPVTREDVDRMIYHYMIERVGEDRALDLWYEGVNEALDDLELQTA